MKARKAVVLLFVFVFTFNLAGATGIVFEKLSLKEGLERAKSEGKKVFIDVYATWCGPCKYLSSNVFTDKDLGDYMSANFICLKLDGEKEDGASLMRDFDLSAYPTLLFLSPEKALLKKIVGVVSAAEIQSAGTDVMHPEKTAIYQLERKYQRGNRDQAFLKEYIEELMLEERDTESVVREYLELFPDLSLEDEQEFTIFTIGIDEYGSAYTKDFIKNSKRYKTLHGDLAEEKMKMILMGSIMEASELSREELLEERVAELYMAYSNIFGENGLDQADLLAAMKEIYQDVSE